MITFGLDLIMALIYKGSDHDSGVGWDFLSMPSHSSACQSISFQKLTYPTPWGTECSVVAELGEEFLGFVFYTGLVNSHSKQQEYNTPSQILDINLGLLSPYRPIIDNIIIDNIISLTIFQQKYFRSSDTNKAAWKTMLNITGNRIKQSQTTKFIMHEMKTCKFEETTITDQ